MNESRIPTLFLVGSAALAAAVSGLYAFRTKPTVSAVPAAVPPAGNSIVQAETPAPDPDPEPLVAPPPVAARTPAGESASVPGPLVEQIGAALEAGDLEKLGGLIGSDALDEAAIQELARLVAGSPDIEVEEVGEIELNRSARWALRLDGQEPGRDRIFLDLVRENGRWSVRSVTLPPPDDQVADAALPDDPLGIADAFLQAVLRQEFETAKRFADPSAVSDAKIAGLCILFEAGNYRLRAERPLRAMLRRPDTSGFLASVVAADGSDAAEFSLILRANGQDASWRVTDLNLDDLLTDYAGRVAGGDVYYAPIIKNPKGGETLVLYFAFDEDTLAPRSQRQLGIVAHLLMTDPGKKLTLSGHTDALGTEEYNEQLSIRRAAAVKEFLVKSGVAEGQIDTKAKGQSQPRRPNFTEAGGDNPEGRRANRRAEIYLDFE